MNSKRNSSSSPCQRAAPVRLGLVALAILLTLSVLGLGCSRDPYPGSDLPPSAELGSPRSQRITRVITHFHSPYSWDACDKNGRPGGVVNSSCLSDLRNAMCHNRIDSLFLSDHPDAMAQFEFTDLLLFDGSKGDSITSKSGRPFTNTMRGCENGQETVNYVGFESKLMALAMTQHLSGTPDERGSKYGGSDDATISDLHTTSDAFVSVPHTEGWSVTDLLALDSNKGPDAIEIYNVHANLDPKIRKRDLGLPPFETIPSVITYLLDPLGDLEPDFMFVSFVSLHTIYLERWNSLIASALQNASRHKPVALGGTDSHQNVFKQKGADGERLDAHRRLSRFMTAHYLVSSPDPDSVKAAVQQGHGWIVFEGFGSPVGMDINASEAGAFKGPGETLSLATAGGSTTLTVRMPTLHSSSAGLRDAAGVRGLSSVRPARRPEVRIELHRIDANGSDTVVSRSDSGDISLSTSSPGAYRAELFIIPKHLNELLRPFDELADREYRWIITNPIYVGP